MSEFRIEKRRAAAELTLTTGAIVRGSFFLSGSSALSSGPERVAELLNEDAGFFPFELNAAGRPVTVLYNRAHLVMASLVDGVAEPQLESGYGVATERAVRLLLSTGLAVEGRVRVYRPTGHDRLSDYARTAQMFRYVETPASTLVVNSAHIVELREPHEP